MYRTIETLILASASPRRRELLQSVGIDFKIQVSGTEEIQRKEETPEAFVRRLALEKAQAVAVKEPTAWVIGADTDVVLDGVILGKPQDKPDAQRLLSMIQGRTHEVWGAFALVSQARKESHIQSARSLVTIASMNEDQIRDYIETGEPMDKAGAYAIQGIGASLVTKVEGSYTNVVGLDLPAVMSMLLKYKVVGISA